MSQRGRSMKQQPAGHALPGMFFDWLSRGRPAPTIDSLMEGPRGPLVDMVKSMPALNQAALATALIPGLGDGIGALADARMYIKEPESRTPGNALLSMAGLLPFVPGMTVFHGTPHRFAPEPDAPHGKFRLDKIGTGEGAQAYGHGIYVAESPDVAGSYRTAGTSASYIGDPLTDAEGIRAARLLEKAIGEPPRDPYGDQDWDRWVTEMLNTHGDAIERNLSAGEIAELQGFERFAAGSMYSVDLPDDQIAKMLDWDAPLSEQPESVREIVRRHADLGSMQASSARAKLEDMDLIANNDRALYDRWQDGAGPLAKLAARVARGEGTKADIKRINWYFREYAGDSADYLSDVEARHGLSVGDALRKAGISDPQKGAELSREIHGIGFPGIRYFDADSRTVPEGTRNFVLFDPDIAKIIDRK